MDAVTENWLLRINNLKINTNIVIFFRKTILGSLKISKKIKNNHQSDLVKKSWYTSLCQIWVYYKNQMAYKLVAVI